MAGRDDGLRHAVAAPPFTNHPFGVGSIFIIDLLYTLPLPAGVLVGVTRSAWGGLPWVYAGLAVSTAYLAWSAAAQWHVRGVAQASLAEPVPPGSLLVTPAPFNTLLWRVVVMRPDGSFDEGFRSLFDGDRPIRWDRFATEPAPASLRALPAGSAWRRFRMASTRCTRRAARPATDLRMGQEPNYSFSFTVAQEQGGVRRPVAPRNEGARGDVRRGLAWVWERMWGADVPPPR